MFQKNGLNYMFYIGSILGLFSCSNSKTIFKETDSRGEKIIIREGRFQGCDYIQLEKRNHKKLTLKLFTEFNCASGMDIYLRKNLFDAKGNYTSTWHAVSDTTGNLKLFGKDLIPALQRTKHSFTKIDKEEVELFMKISDQMNKNQYKHKLPAENINKIIGWINATTP